MVLKVRFLWQIKDISVRVRVRVRVTVSVSGTVTVRVRVSSSVRARGGVRLNTVTIQIFFLHD